MTDAVLGHGALLKRGDGAGSEAFTTIAEVISISGPSLSRDVVEATNMDSTSGWREFIGGLKSGGEISFELNYDPADATIDASGGLIDDIDQTTARNYQLVFPDSATTTWSFAGWLTSFETNIPLDDRITASATVTLSGVPTLA
jgi:predicted secreted protein